MNTQSSRASGAERPWGAIALVSALALRALVPAGFMVEPVHGRAEIVLCGSHPGHSIHAHAGVADPSGHRAGVDPTCPFAQSAAPPILATLPVAPAVFEGAAAPSRALDVVAFVPSGPIRQQSQRGPPHFT